jgi:hypothetical protein
MGLTALAPHSAHPSEMLEVTPTTGYAFPRYEEVHHQATVLPW